MISKISAKRKVREKLLKALVFAAAGLSDFLRHHGETLARASGPGRLHGRIQRINVSLHGNGGDHIACFLHQAADAFSFISDHKSQGTGEV